jgi:branched-chain amino acid transport system ATP-binding protein
MRLEVRGLEAGYGDTRVLFGIDLDIGHGELVTLLGRNGMGKTTTVRAILGLVPPMAGRVVIDGRDVAGLPPHRIARLGIGLVPEGRQVFPSLTVEEHLRAVARPPTSTDREPWTVARIFGLFPALAERRHSPGRQLSGGEQQMLAIGRALSTNPELLILDEATEGLAPLVRREIWRVLGELRASGLSILLIDKHVEAMLRLADRHHVIEKGRIVWSGSSAAFRAERALTERYLGV